MKRIVSLILALVLVFSFAACGAKTETATETDTTTAEGTTKWKDRMATMTIPEDTSRIVIFQNFIQFNKVSEEGEKLAFDKFGENPVVATEMTIAGETVKAYPISLLKDVWGKAVEGDLTVIDKDGNKTTIKADDLSAAYVATLADGTGVLKTASAEVKNFKYLITANKEALVFVEAEETLTVKDLYTTVGWDTAGTFYYVASDAYWCFTEKQDQTEASEIRGTLSGSVNCALSLDDAMGGAGKINDIFFIAMGE